MAQLKQLTRSPATLGEGPCWHEGEQVLYWVDIWGKALHRFHPETGNDERWDIGEMVGTVAPRRSGGLILGLERGFAFFDPATEEIEHLPRLEDDTIIRFNDGKCRSEREVLVRLDGSEGRKIDRDTLSTRCRSFVAAVCHGRRNLEWNRLESRTGRNVLY